MTADQNLNLEILRAKLMNDGDETFIQIAELNDDELNRFLELVRAE